MTQFTKADLRQLNPLAIARIAKAFYKHENSEGKIGSTKEGHITYIVRAQQALAAGGMDFLGIWHVMRLSEGDLKKFRVETLRKFYSSIGARDLSLTATKKELIEVLLKCRLRGCMKT